MNVIMWIAIGGVVFGFTSELGRTMCRTLGSIIGGLLLPVLHKQEARARAELEEAEGAMLGTALSEGRRRAASKLAKGLEEGAL